MNRKTFVEQLLLLGITPLATKASRWVPEKKENDVRLLRHATLVIQLGKIRFLVDPMLSPKDAMDPIQNAGNNTRIPMVDLPIDEHELKLLLNEIDAVLVTHTHRDHWDLAAQTLISKDKPVFCQPADLEKIKAQGFLNVVKIDDRIIWKGISISRTKGRHGTGEVEKKMGTVSGFVLTQRKKSIYIAGDTIWCDEVNEALNRHRPAVSIVNCGAPQYITGGGPITMTPEDILMVHKELPSTQIIAVHMDTINHCRVSRADLKRVLQQNHLLSQVIIPADGERIPV